MRRRTGCQSYWSKGSLLCFSFTSHMLSNPESPVQACCQFPACCPPGSCQARCSAPFCCAAVGTGQGANAPELQASGICHHLSGRVIQSLAQADRALASLHGAWLHVTLRDPAFSSQALLPPCASPPRVQGLGCQVPGVNNRCTAFAWNPFLLIKGLCLADIHRNTLPALSSISTTAPKHGRSSGTTCYTRS